MSLLGMRCSKQRGLAVDIFGGAGALILSRFKGVPSPDCPDSSEVQSTYLRQVRNDATITAWILHSVVTALNIFVTSPCTTTVS